MDTTGENCKVGREVRSWVGWTRREKTARSGRGEEGGVSLQLETGLRKDRTAGWSVPHFLRAVARIRTGALTGVRCWPLLAGVWRANAPLMKPRAEGEVLTAANLNLYRGRRS